MVDYPVVSGQCIKANPKDQHHQGACCTGKGGVGKSSTANSLFNEKVANVAAMQNDAARPATISRTAAGFELHVIDTPSILEGDALDEGVRAVQKSLLQYRVIMCLLKDLEI